MRVDHVQVPRAKGKILRLHRRAARAVDLIDGLRHLVEVGEVIERGPSAPALQVGDERRPVDRRRDHVVAAEDHRAGLVPGLELEGRGRLGHVFHDECPLEADSVFLDPHAGLPEEVLRPLVQEIDADLFEDGHRLLVDGVDFLGRKLVVRLQAVLPHSRSILTQRGVW